MTGSATSVMLEALNIARQLRTSSSEQIAAIEAALEQAGFAIVPVEFSFEMRRAYWALHDAALDPPGPDEEWQAMLSAARQQEAQDDD